MSFTQRIAHVTRKSYDFFSQFWSKSSHGRTSNIIRGNNFQKWLFSWMRQCINFDILWIHDIFTKNILKSRKFWAHSKRNLLFIRYIYTDLLGKTIDIFLAIEQFCFKICPMSNGCCARGVTKLRKLLEADHDPIRLNLSAVPFQRNNSVFLSQQISISRFFQPAEQGHRWSVWCNQEQGFLVSWEDAAFVIPESWVKRM